ncbi:MAG: hypothetical protein JW803_01040 [Endomicrobiales bacterium]|nr:hypothetical protein [Endomicrobiales bacterium]
MNSEYLFSEKEITKFKIGRVIKRDGRVVAFNKNKITDSIFRAAVEVGGADRALAESLAGKVVKKINEAYKKDSLPSVEEIQDIIERVLVENGHYKTAKAYILYRAEHQRMREEKTARIVVEDNIPYKTLWKVFNWNAEHGCETVEKLNAHIRNGTYGKLVSEAEAYYHNEIKSVAEKIAGQAGRVRLVIISGPSSSGKTTTTIKIGERLKEKGLSLAVLNLDNYFKDIDEHPKDKYGDHDFETPQALDLPLINEHLFRLLNGEKVAMPEYDFMTGRRKLGIKEMRLKQDQLLLIDSLHGLYPEMTSSVPHEMKFRFYIEALCQIKDKSGEFMRWADLRMMRRMVRDSLHRGYRPEQTVGHWHYVRRSEMKNIVPFINKVDYVFNGALPYELPAYKSHLCGSIRDIVRKFEKDPGKLDACMRAKRVGALLDEVLELEDTGVIPKNSLLREFIGGSSYKY